MKRSWAMSSKFLVFFFLLAAAGDILLVKSSSSSSSSSSDLSVRQQLIGVGVGGARGLKENLTFDCSPSGPCLPCLYHEKKDVSYRCSETGYRIPMRCVKIGSGLDEEDKKHKDRNLLEDDSSNVEEVGSEEIYVTYRSCIPAVNEEKLSVLGFEALMLLLLISSSLVIFRRKGSFAMPGAIRLPTTTTTTTSRF